MAQQSHGSTSASERASRAGDRIGEVVGQVEGVANRVAAQGREAGEGMQEVAGNVKDAIDKSVREQPMATIAVAALLGFALGALWKS
jgi:ElaB/YqjD/DUF883 family membrane-anchored ribosome-binding protein